MFTLTGKRNLNEAKSIVRYITNEYIDLKFSDGGGPNLCRVKK